MGAHECELSLQSTKLSPLLKVAVNGTHHCELSLKERRLSFAFYYSCPAITARERESERDCFFEESTAVPSQGADAMLLVPSALNVNVVSLNQAGVNSGSDCDSPKAANCLVI